MVIRVRFPPLRLESLPRHPPRDVRDSLKELLAHLGPQQLRQFRVTEPGPLLDLVQCKLLLLRQLAENGPQSAATGPCNLSHAAERLDGGGICCALLVVLGLDTAFPQCF